MTTSQIVQLIAENQWLVTPALANSFVADGVSLPEMQARRKRFNRLYGPSIFDPQSKTTMPYYGGYKRKHKKEMGDVEIYGEEEQEDNGEPIVKNGIGIIHIKGPITKESYCSSGTDDINNLLIQFGQDPNIRGVLLVVDSGGGQVSGTETLANTVQGFNRTYKKRIEAFVDGVAGSAAYWIISGADKITLSGETSSVGSIGTMATIVNTDKMNNTIGFKVDNIYATISKNKNLEYEQAQKGNFDPMRTNVLDKLNTVFVRQVIKGRYRGKYVAEELNVENVPEQLSGRMYFGSDAKTIGLADSINTLADTLALFDMRSQQQEQIESMGNEINVVEDIKQTIPPPTKALNLTPLKSIGSLKK